LTSVFHASVLLLIMNILDQIKFLLLTMAWAACWLQEATFLSNYVAWCSLSWLRCSYSAQISFCITTIPCCANRDCNNSILFGLLPWVTTGPGFNSISPEVNYINFSLETQYIHTYFTYIHTLFIPKVIVI